MKALFNLIMDLVAIVINIIKRIFKLAFDKFMEVNACEKGIVAATVLAFAAVVSPMARYYMFEQYYSINNPIAHYMIGIALIMLITVYYPGLIAVMIRVAVNALYVCGIIYLAAAHEISKAPYEITAGYYLNIVAPLVYMGLAVASELIFRKS